MDQPQFFLWKPEFELGVPAIDHQHRRFFDLLNALHLAVGRRDDWTDLRRLFRDLEGQVRQHFAQEELFLAEAAYPGLAAHQREHAAFVAQLSSIVISPSASTRAALCLVKDWLLQHVLDTDRAYVAWLGAHRLQPPPSGDEMATAERSSRHSSVAACRPRNA